MCIRDSMRALYAWCSFKQHEKLSDDFFEKDPLDGASEERTQKNLKNLCWIVVYIY